MKKSRWIPALQLAVVMAAVTALSACDKAPTEVPVPKVETVTESVVVESVPTNTQEQPVLTEELLAQSVGTYPNDGNTSYLEVGPLAERLKALLGDEKYKVLLLNMDVASPLAKDGDRYFVTGNRQHQGGEEMAAIVADPSQNALRVLLVTEGKSHVFQDPEQVNVPWPADVQTMMGNVADAAKQ